MRVKVVHLSLLLGILVVVVTPLVVGQVTKATLAGVVTGPSGAVVPGARISIKSLNTGEMATTQTDAAGLYNLPNLAPGDYEVSVSAEGFATKVERITLASGAAQTLNAALAPPAQTPTENLPNVPSSSTTAPSLQDLGFSSAQIQGNAKEQALLDKRTHMLKIHQRLGLITTAPMIATVVTSIGAGGKRTSNTDRTVHMVLGSVTSDLYFTSAYFALRAPRVPGTQSRGQIRFHKAMAWIHGPGMILTPILGAMAYAQKNNGEKVHGIAAAHGPVAIVTAGAFGAALLSVSMKF